MLTSLLILASYTWVIDGFCRKQFEVSSPKSRLYAVLLFACLLANSIIYVHYAVPYIVYALLFHVIMIGFVQIAFRADAGKKLLAALIMIAVIEMSGNFCDSALCFLMLFILHTVRGIPEPFLADWHSDLIACIHIAAVTLTIYGMSGRLVSVFRGKTRQWYITASVPLLALIGVIDAADWGATRGILLISRNDMGLYYDQLFSHAEIGVLAALSAFAAAFYIYGMNKIYVEQQKSGRYRSQIAAYKMMEEQYHRSERLRHDMKNHIIALSGLLESREYDKMGGYLTNMVQSGKLDGGGDATGSKAVDALLFQKKTYAEQNDILWECDVRIPRSCVIDEFDLCVLFGNLLDNAVEACDRMSADKDRFINIQGNVVKSCFLLEIRNSADVTDIPNMKYDPVHFSNMSHDSAEITKMLQTHKRNTEEHGIGLVNVIDMVRNYNGVMDITVENGIFTTSVLIPLHSS